MATGPAPWGTRTCSGIVAIARLIFAPGGSAAPRRVGQVEVGAAVHDQEPQIAQDLARARPSLECSRRARRRPSPAPRDCATASAPPNPTATTRSSPGPARPRSPTPGIADRVPVRPVRRVAQADEQHVHPVPAREGRDVLVAAGPTGTTASRPRSSRSSRWAFGSRSAHVLRLSEDVVDRPGALAEVGHAVRQHPDAERVLVQAMHPPADPNRMGLARSARPGEPGRRSARRGTPWRSSGRHLSVRRSKYAVRVARSPCTVPSISVSTCRGSS